jgi:hypothetical protein
MVAMYIGHVIIITLVSDTFSGEKKREEKTLFWISLWK